MSKFRVVAQRIFFEIAAMIYHTDLNSFTVFRKIKNKEILFAGNKRLKIYGKLNCFSGKRMRKENRVFFTSEKEALENGYRVCGHCMNEQYKNWKRSVIA